MNRLVCLVSIALAACSGDRLQGVPQDPTPLAPQAPPAVQPLTAVEVCAVYLSYNDNSNLCLAGTGKTGLDYSEVDLAARCRPGTEGREWAEDLLLAVAESRVRIDWKLARACLATSRELRTTTPGVELLASADWQAVKDGLCHDFYKGGIAEGSACQEDWDCPDEMLCMTDAPTVPGSNKCMKRGIEGSLCSDSYHPCAEEHFCNNGSCSRLVSAGGSCQSDGECVSGLCQGTPPTCAPAPPAQTLRALGQTCFAIEECADQECVSCRAASAGGIKTCQILGGKGAYCETWDDCAYDLGCTDNVCTTVGEYRDCGPGNGAWCESGLYCIPPVQCMEFDYDETACVSNQPTCGYDAETGICDPVQGVCTGLPTSGPCAFGYVCDPTLAFCDPVTTQCIALATLGAACDNFGETAPPCLATLACNEGTCQSFCEYDEDCGEGSYCDYYQTLPTCVPKSAESCTSDAQCLAGYCSVPVCQALEGQQQCESAGCTYGTTGVCENDTNCWASDDNPAGCAALGSACTYDAESGDCEQAGACGELSDAAACTGNPICAWTETPFCDYSCNAHGTEAECAADNACSYSGFGYCLPTVSCWGPQTQAECETQAGCAFTDDGEGGGYCDASVPCYNLDQAACSAEPLCSYTQNGYCTFTNGLPPGSCEPTREVGATCTYAAECQSGDCYFESDEAATGVCAVTTSGCNHDGPFVRLAFLFGCVWALKRRRQFMA